MPFGIMTRRPPISGRFGAGESCPLVTAQDKTRLMELHKAIGSAAEEVLKDKGESKALKDIVKKITALSSGSYQALL